MTKKRESWEKLELLYEIDVKGLDRRTCLAKAEVTDPTYRRWRQELIDKWGLDEYPSRLKEAYLGDKSRPNYSLTRLASKASLIEAGDRRPKKLKQGFALWRNRLTGGYAIQEVKHWELVEYRQFRWTKSALAALERQMRENPQDFVDDDGDGDD